VKNQLNYTEKNENLEPSNEMGLRFRIPARDAMKRRRAATSSRRCLPSVKSAADERSCHPASTIDFEREDGKKAPRLSHGVRTKHRVDVADGWYHITARGIERRTIFTDERDHAHFLALLPALRERYGLEIHAYVLMGNHYHLLIRTPQANASAAIQWLNVSYSLWFNRRRGRVGHVFQGRFASVLIDGAGAWCLAASGYLHLNPIRTKSAGLGKSSNRAEARGLAPLDRAAVQRRLKQLQAYRWSSYGAYAGYGLVPDWLTTKVLLARSGGRKAYRRYVEQFVRRGACPEGLEGLGVRLALGSVAFLEQLKGWVGRMTKEQPARRQVLRRVTVAQVVAVVERHRGEPWTAFAQRHGDWGRELVLYLARQRTGLTLKEIGAALGIGEYKTVGKAVQRFTAAISEDGAKRRLAKECLHELSLVEA
jgi:REP element-mobilizing transposase RayT